MSARTVVAKSYSCRIRVSEMSYMTQKANFSHALKSTCATDLDRRELLRL